MNNSCYWNYMNTYYQVLLTLVSQFLPNINDHSLKIHKILKYEIKGKL